MSNERLVPQDRALPALKNPDEAWKVVLEWAPLIFKNFRKRLCLFTGVNLSWKGAFFGADFEWISRGHYAGRSVTDLAEEIFPGVLESVLVAADAFDPDLGELPVHLTVAVYTGTLRELKYWQATSGTEAHLEEFQSEFSDDTEPHEPEPDIIAMNLIELALTAKEYRALQMHADGVTLSTIADTLGFADPSGAHYAIKRAIVKAREALEEVDPT